MFEIIKLNLSGWSKAECTPSVKVYRLIYLDRWELPSH